MKSRISPKTQLSQSTICDVVNDSPKFPSPVLADPVFPLPLFASPELKFPWLAMPELAIPLFAFPELSTPCVTMPTFMTKLVKIEHPRITKSQIPRHSPKLSKNSHTTANKKTFFGELLKLQQNRVQDPHGYTQMPLTVHGFKSFLVALQ